jgi:hypothetical protein
MWYLAFAVAILMLAVIFWFTPVERPLPARSAPHAIDPPGGK